MQTSDGSSHATQIPASGWTTAAMVIVVCTAFASQMALPLWVGAIIDDYALTAERAGIVAAVEYGAVALASVILATSVHKLNLNRVSVIGMVVLLLGNGGAVFATEFESLLATRGLAGLGKGMVIAAIFSLAARTPSPTKSFAIINGAYTALATLIYLTLPLPIQGFGAPGAFGALFLIALVGSAFLFWVPTARAISNKIQNGVMAEKFKVSLSGILVLLALIMMWAANGSVWTYVERLGQLTGLSLPKIGLTLSIAAALAILGPVAAHFIHDRFGFRKPIVLGVILKMIAAFVLCNWLFVGAYIVAAPLFVLAALFIVPYLMSLMSQADRTGRLAAAAGGLLTAGSSIGAYLGGVTMTYATPAVLSAVAIGLLLGVIILVDVAIRRMR